MASNEPPPAISVVDDIADDPNFVAIEEGQVKVYQPANVFYNKVQEFNRDLRYYSFIDS